MPTAEITKSPPRGFSFLRHGLPLLLVALGILAVTVCQIWPAPDWALVDRVVSSMLCTMLTLLLLTAWLVCLSGWRWWLRLAIPLAGILFLIWGKSAVFSDIKFTGNMVPVFHFRWEPSAADILEAARRAQAGAEVAAADDLSGDRPADYPEYRGRKRDGVVKGPPLMRRWSEPPRQLWEQPVGGGFASFVVAGNSAITIEQRRDTEAVVSYDVATGRERWVYSWPGHFSEAMGGDGPRATPTIAGGDVYALGANGHLACLEGKAGKLKWEVEILGDNPNIQWAMSGSPLVYDQVVVVNPGKQSDAAEDHAVVAYDRATGKEVWHAGNTRAGYSSPMLATLAGQRQVLLLDGEGVGGYDADKGTELWRHPWKTQPEINVAQPIVLDGDRVFISSGYGKGCAMLKVERAEGKLQARQLWSNLKLRCRFTSPVAYKEHLYGLDEGVLVCLEAATGNRLWKDGRYDHGQLLLCDDLLVVLAENGDLALVEATPRGHHELGRFPALKGKTWNYLAVADGKAYVRNDRWMACYDLAH